MRVIDGVLIATLINSYPTFAQDLLIIVLKLFQRRHLIILEDVKKLTQFGINQILWKVNLWIITQVRINNGLTMKQI